MSNVDGAGAAQAKTGKNRQALDRHAGMNACMGAVQSKTRSRYHSSASPYLYKGVSGYGGNENICGYSPGGGRCK